MKSPEHLLQQIKSNFFGSEPWLSQYYLVADQGVSDELLDRFLRAGEKALTSGQFKDAEIGRGQQSQTHKSIRGDSTCWVTEDLCPDFVHFCQSLQQALNESLFVSVKRFETHWALYQSGTGYDTHLDEHQTGWAIDRRYLSFVLYLNRSWKPEDGGELELYPDSPKSVRIQPTWGRLVMFQSDTVPHRVLPSQKPRWSLTGWFRR